MSDLTDRLEATWMASADLPVWAKEIIVHNVILKAQIDALTPAHTDTTYSKVRLAIEAIDRTFGEFLNSKEGGE